MLVEAFPLILFPVWLIYVLSDRKNLQIVWRSPLSFAHFHFIYGWDWAWIRGDSGKTGKQNVPPPRNNETVTYAYEAIIGFRPTGPLYHMLPAPNCKIHKSDLNLPS